MCTPPPPPPECDPGETASCYDGFDQTNGVGECKSGTRTCSETGQWGDCEGQVLPIGEICGNGLDENCSGVADEDEDADGDGFTTCQGDCCDSPASCSDPSLVNPGAFEASDNEVDDDCDAMVDNAVALCDDGLASSSGNPDDYARAMDLCQFTSVDEQKWGVIDARLVLADGTGSPAANSRSIRPDFGATNPMRGSGMAVFATGRAAAQGQTDPAFAAFQPGNSMGTSSDAPADWLAANGGAFPNANCPEPASTTANDPVMLELDIRAPSNARSFRLRSNFFSGEYPEWVCSAYNDMFVVLLDSIYDGDPANPVDKNLATYTAPDDTVYPVGVNLAFGNTGLFRQCTNGATGCELGAIDGETTTCVGTGELAGTGFDVVAPNPPGPAKGGCTDGDLIGGGTGWLEMRGNVVGGEVFTLRIAIWDTNDSAYDSLVLLDDFEWSVESSEPGVVVD